MHIGSPAGQILNLSVNQMEEQLWLCICKTSGELLGSRECRALSKTHPPLQTASKTSPFSKGSCGSGKQDSFGAWGNRAGDEALLCNYGMWQWNEELQGKQREERVSRGAGSSGGSSSWRQCQPDPGTAVSYRSHLQIPTVANGHWQKLPLQREAESAQYWEDPTMRKSISFISVQHPSVLQDKPLATGETLHP